MAVDAQQWFAFELPTGLSATRTTYPTDVYWSTPDARISDIDEVNIDTTEDVDGRRPQANVPVR